MVEPQPIGATPPTGSPHFRWLPGLITLRGYQRRDARGDLVAGLAVTALLVPQGMAYAELAGLPAVTGLYTTVMALLAYAVSGPSRILVLGPDSALAPLILATILPLIGAAGDPAKATALASAMAVIMGIICVVAGLARLGVITELLSKPLRVGYLNGVAVVVVVSQLPKLFGFGVTAESTPARLKEFVVGVADGRTNAAALAISLACLILLFGFKALAPKVPAVLIAVVGTTLAVVAFDLVAHGVAVVGPVPRAFRPLLFRPSTSATSAASPWRPSAWPSSHSPTRRRSRAPSPSSTGARSTPTRTSWRWARQTWRPASFRASR
jgi:MFS superfamily sulfate permease-like transporter